MSTTSSDSLSSGINPTPIEVLPIIDSSKFRIQNSMLHLTYRTHVVFKDWMSFVSTNLTFNIVEYSMVHEIGEKSRDGYEHTHILVKFDKNVQSRNPRIFDFNSLHPHIRRVSSKPYWRNVVNYHTKQGEPYTNIVLDVGSFVDDVWSCESRSDALLANCDNPRQAGGILATFDNKPKPLKIEPLVDWLPWQSKLLHEIETYASDDDRTINWIWDPFGNSGKTFFVKHLADYRDAFVSSHGNVRDLATQLKETLKSQPEVTTALFNFTRQSKEHKIYQALESIKDGLLCAQKYLGGTITLPSPQVYVFANYFPDIYEISLDRWLIRTITSGSDFCHVFTGHDLDQWLRSTMAEFYIDRQEALDKFKSLLSSQLDPAPSRVPPPRATISLPRLGDTTKPSPPRVDPIHPSPPRVNPSPPRVDPLYSPPIFEPIKTPKVQPVTTSRVQPVRTPRVDLTPIAKPQEIKPFSGLQSPIARGTSRSSQPSVTIPRHRVLPTHVVPADSLAPAIQYGPDFDLIKHLADRQRIRPRHNLSS
jgi:hypothetical protein